MTEPTDAKTAPVGWVTVPVEPVSEQIVAMDREILRQDGELDCDTVGALIDQLDLNAIYAAAIAARPAAPPMEGGMRDAIAKCLVEQPAFGFTEHNKLQGADLLMQYLRDAQEPATDALGGVVDNDRPGNRTGDQSAEYCCFFCNEAFTGDRAKEHFGILAMDKPLCIADQSEFAVVRNERNNARQDLEAKKRQLAELYAVCKVSIAALTDLVDFHNEGRIPTAEALARAEAAIEGALITSGETAEQKEAVVPPPSLWREGIEAAAMVAEAYGEGIDPAKVGSEIHERAATRIAAAIRSLPPPPEDGGQ